MEIITPTRTRMTNQVCMYWRRGRCNRNPCRFLHRETEQSAPKKRTWTWRNPGKSEGISKRNIAHPPKQCNARPKELTQTKSEAEHEPLPKQLNQTKSEAEAEALPKEKQLNNQTKSEPKQCKYWINENCVHGEKCKDIHSWFTGSGFTMLAKLEGHTKPITGISLPTGRDKLYSSSNDGSLRIWDCNSGKCASSIIIGSKVGCLASEGAWLYGGLENEVKAWNFENEREYSLKGVVGSVCSMAVDDDVLYAGLQDGTIMVWKWNSESNIHEATHVLKGHDGAVRSLVIGAGRLYSGSRDSTIKAWDLQTMQCLQTLYGHASDVTSVLCWSSYLLSYFRSSLLCAAYSMLKKNLFFFVPLATAQFASTTYPRELINVNVKILEKGSSISSFANHIYIFCVSRFTERGRIFSKRPVEVIQIGTDGLFFTGDATGDVSVWKLLGSPSFWVSIKNQKLFCNFFHFLIEQSL